MSDRSRVERAIARAIASSSGSLSNGLKRTATESDCAARKRVLASVLPVTSIAGRPRPERFRTSHISIPLISGMSISTTMHAFDVGISLAINSDGLANILTANPEAEISLLYEQGRGGSCPTPRRVQGWG